MIKQQLPVDIKLLTVADVQQLTGIKSYTTLKRYMDVDKTLPYRKIGKGRQFTIDDVKAFLDNQRIN